MAPTTSTRRLRNYLMAGTVAILGLGAIGTVGAVQAQGSFNEMRVHGPGFGGPFGGHGLDRALKSVDATDEQRDRIWAIVDEARAELRPMVRDFDDRKEQFSTLVAAETIDRAAFETLRQQSLATGDTVSARAMEAFLDAADVLTPEQRAELIAQRRGFGPGFGPGRN